jgi:hypothetical protein
VRRDSSQRLTRMGLGSFRSRWSEGPPHAKLLADLLFCFESLPGLSSHSGGRQESGSIENRVLGRHLPGRSAGHSALEASARNASPWTRLD